MNLINTLAYLDPGTGAMIIQGLIGAVLGGLYILKLYWYRIIGFITGNKDTDDETEVENDD